MHLSLVFYWHPMSSSTPIACALAELAVPHDRVRVDIRSGEQRTPEYLAINPNGKVPCLVVDGTPIFEALAIHLWLGARFGVAQGLWPQEGTPERLQAMSWSAWAYVTYGPAINRLRLASTEGALHSAGHAEDARVLLQQLLGILEARLSAQRWLVGDAYSLVDLLVAHVVGYGVHVGAGVEQHPAVARWLQQVMARPAMQGDA